MAMNNSAWVARINNVTNFLNSGDASNSKDLSVNPSLIFNKYIYWNQIIPNVPTFHQKSFRNGEEHILKNHYKINHFEKIINSNLPLDVNTYNYLKSRKNQIFNVSNRLNGCIEYPKKRCFELKTKTKIIVNHGVNSVLENSISFHPYYGFPIIPGSAIKGVTRNYCEEFEILEDSEIRSLFGNAHGTTNSLQGTIVFFDAWPSLEDCCESNKKIKLSDFYELDVFTPHYKEYYQGDSFPSDNQDPNPVNFLAVKEKIKFEFVVGSTSKSNNSNLETDLVSIEHFISKALRTFGIGAKTGSNYGYFE